MPRQISALLLLACLFGGVGCNSGSQGTALSPEGAEEASSTASAGAPQTAGDVVAAFSDFYRNTKSFRVTNQVEVSLEIEEGKTPEGFEPMTMSRTWVVGRPNRFLFRTGDGFSVVSDGERLFTANPGGMRYCRMPAPSHLADLRDEPIAALFHGPDMMRTLLLSGDDPDAALEFDAESTDVAYVGLETLDDVSAHHLQVEQDQDQDEDDSEEPIRVDVWIAAAGDPVLLRQRVRHPKQYVEYARGQVVEAEIVATESYSGWETDPSDFETATRFDPSAAARRVAGLGDVFSSDHEMLGQRAPDVELPLLDGETRKLSDHVDKDVVMLDFWASWCGPCRMGMPIMAKLADEFRDRGVVLYAVNLREEPEDVTRALSQDGLDVTVALDAEGEISSQFQVGPIPHMTIVGRDGTIQGVHVGVSGNPQETEDSMREILEALVSGRNIAKDGLPH